MLEYSTLLCFVNVIYIGIMHCISFKVFAAAKETNPLEEALFHQTQLQFSDYQDSSVETSHLGERA